MVSWYDVVFCLQKPSVNDEEWAERWEREQWERKHRGVGAYERQSVDRKVRAFAYVPVPPRSFNYRLPSQLPNSSTGEHRGQVRLGVWCE